MDSDEFKKYVKENGIVTLKADKSSSAGEEINTLLTALGNTSRAIPYYAIFPADNPKSPITFAGLLTTAGVMEKLKQAGPSKNYANVTTVEKNGIVSTKP